MRRFLLLWVVALGILLGENRSASAAPSYEKGLEEGQALAKRLRTPAPNENSEYKGILEMRDENGQRTRVPIQFATRVNVKDWRAIYETNPAAPKVAHRLVVVHYTNGPNLYLYGKVGLTTTNPGPTELTSEQAAIPFAGSDFWLIDLGLDFLHWPYQRVLKTETRRGRSCRVLESIDPRRVAGSYSRVVSWIDIETDGLIRAEAYDQDSHLLKEFTVGSFKKVKGKWELQDMEIRNDQTDSRTRLEFKVD